MNNSEDAVFSEKRVLDEQDHTSDYMMTPQSKICKKNTISPVNITVNMKQFRTIDDNEYKNLLNHEKMSIVNQYIDDSTAITPSIRGMLVDWIMSVCAELGFYRDTFHTAINIMDRYLSKNPDTCKEDLQGLGAASLSIASKIIETHIQGCVLFSECTANTCSAQEISDNERKIMNCLDCYVPISPVCGLMRYYINILLNYREQESSLSMTDFDYELLFFKCVDIYDRLLIDSSINSFKTSHILICILYSFSIDYNISASLFRFLPDILTLSTDCQQWILSVAKTAPAHSSIAFANEVEFQSVDMSQVNLIQTHNQFSFSHFIQMLDDSKSVSNTISDIEQEC